jgi:UDP-N-acetylmuramyl tripeptide synthase
LGAGATWSGEIALRLDPHILPKLLLKIQKGIIIVAGTNGKTTTSLMIKKILEDQGFSVLHNESGANLLNGIVSSFFAVHRETYDYAVFEVDENSLTSVLSNLRTRNKEPITIVLLNLFRDQLDRYGEVDTIARKWQTALKDLTKHTELIINADDPHLAFIGEQICKGVGLSFLRKQESKISVQGRNDNKNRNILYFGINDKTYYLPKIQHATDTIFCPSCGNRLTFKGVYFSHLGDWKCPNCGFTHPKLTLTSLQVTSPLEGVYNIYNTLAATLASEIIGIDKKQMQKSLKNFMPSFGRMENVRYKGKNIIILLSKNPTGFNESLRTVLSSEQKGPMLLVLNDRVPDGTDVSWIWDVDFEMLDDYHYPLIISGDRAFDMGLRIKYGVTKYEVRSTKQIHIEENVKKAVEQFVSEIKEGETGWVLATYSAMLDVRKIITGKKIL